jgi:hypothetical protein
VAGHEEDDSALLSDYVDYGGEMACKNCGQSHAIGMSCGVKAPGVMSDKAVNTSRIPKGIALSVPKGIDSGKKPTKIKP